MFYYADPAFPVWNHTRAYTESSTGPELIEVAPGSGPPFGLITTQTCDITEENSTKPLRPWVQIAPVFDGVKHLDSGWRKKLERHRGPNYWMHLPALDGFQVVDLRIEMPVEKGWLANQIPLPAFENEEGFRILASRLAFLRERPAIPDVIVRLVQRSLASALGSLNEVDLEFHTRIDNEVTEIGIAADDWSEPTSVQLAVLFEETVSPEVWEWLSNWHDGVMVACLSEGVTLMALDFQSYGELSAADYRKMIRVPLAG
ncbi:MAG: hypothetical protein K8R99_02350 [Actinomycetia bacterium]|nr:hypothetical protein [Actinomycetes bacterium]